MNFIKVRDEGKVNIALLVYRGLRKNTSLFFVNLINTLFFLGSKNGRGTREERILLKKDIWQAV